MIPTLVTAALAVPQLVLAGATVHDGTGAAPMVDAAVVVRDGRIEAVGPRAEVAIPAGARVVDVSGKFITPGLIDTHVHYSQTGWADGRPDALDPGTSYARTMADNAAHPERFHRAFLRAGITAVFDVGGYPWTRRLQAACEGAADAPHVVATGALLTPWVPPPLRLHDQAQFVLMEDEDGVRAAVRGHADLGSAAIKVWLVTRPDAPLERTAPLVHAAGDEARRRGLPLVVHATSLAAAKVAVAAGAGLLVHSVDDRPVDDEFVAAVKARGTFYCPTLTVRDGYRQLYFREPSAEVLAQLDDVHPSVAARVRRTADVRPDEATPKRVRQAMAARLEIGRQTMADNLARLHAAGVPVVLGTDAGNPLTLHGPSVFAELEAMAAAGLPPRAVLVAATRDAARAIGRGEHLGVLAEGRIADLLVLGADPAAAVTAWRTVEQVCRAGVLRRREDIGFETAGERR